MRMKATAGMLVGLLLAVSVGATQATVPGQFVIEARLFAADPAVEGSIEVLASPTFRTVAGRAATMDLRDATSINGLRVSVTPSDLGSGKVGLQVVIETRQTGKVSAASFDLLTGSGTAVATVALIDGAGRFMLDSRGRPLFAAFKATGETGVPDLSGPPYAPGNGVSWPSVVREAKPEYTDAARRAKLQGAV